MSRFGDLAMGNMKFKIIYFTLSILVGKPIFAQSIKERFTVEVQIDNAWTLDLKKNNTYVYIGAVLPIKSVHLTPEHTKF